MYVSLAHSFLKHLMNFTKPLKFFMRFLNCVNSRICTTVEPKIRMLSQIPQPPGKIPQLLFFSISSNLRTHMTSPNSSHLYSVHRYKMSADELLGSHQLNSFATSLEETLPMSSDSSRIKIPQHKPQLKKIEDDRKQKGGKKLEQNTGFEILRRYMVSTARQMKKFMEKRLWQNAK